MNFSYNFYKSDKFILKYLARLIFKKLSNINSSFDTSQFVLVNNDYVSNDILIDGFYEGKELKILCEWLKKKKNLLPIYKNWFNYWKKRMKKNEIYADAENLKTKNNKLVEIGTKIQNNLPSYQYMGIIKLGREKFFEMKKFYKKINNKKIDMTSFINECLKSKILNIDVVKYSKFWFEIDSGKDIKVAENGLK